MPEHFKLVLLIRILESGSGSSISVNPKLTPDLYPDPEFDDQKYKKNTAENFFFFFLIKKFSIFLS
jgi:hypothetical protein